MEIKEFIDSMLIAMGNMDFATLEPMNHLMFHPLFAKQWVEKIEKVIDIIKENGISMDELAKCVTGPSHLRCQFFFLLLDLKCAKIEKYRRVRITNFFMELLKKIAVKDIYGLKSNIIHSDKEIKEMVNRIKWNKGDEKVSKLLGRLYNAAYHVINGLYTDFYTDYGIECFGQHDLEDNKILVIKHFFDLNPKELWNSNLSCKKLVIYTIYKDVQFKCDAVSVHTVYEGNPTKGLVEWAIEVDGEFVNDINEIKELKNKLEIKSIEQWQRLTGLKFEELKKKGVEMRGYVFKDLFEKVGIEWKSDEKMLEAVKDKPFADETYWGAAEGEKEFWIKLLDPAEDFYPKGA